VCVCVCARARPHLCYGEDEAVGGLGELETAGGVGEGPEERHGKGPEGLDGEVADPAQDSVRVGHRVAYADVLVGEREREEQEDHAVAAADKVEELRAKDGGEWSAATGCSRNGAARKGWWPLATSLRDNLTDQCIAETNRWRLQAVEEVVVVQHEAQRDNHREDLKSERALRSATHGCYSP